MANAALLFHGKGEAFTSPFALHVQFKGLLSLVVLKGQSQSLKQVEELTNL